MFTIQCRKSLSWMLLTVFMDIESTDSFTLSTSRSARTYHIDHSGCHSCFVNPSSFHNGLPLKRRLQPLSSSKNDVQNKNKTKAVQKKGKGYQQIGAPINPHICSLTKSEILQQIKERSKARRSRNFQKADEILSNLKRDNVFVNDATKQWRADGRSFLDFTSPETNYGNSGSGGSSSSIGQMGKGTTAQKEYIEYTKARNSKSISPRDEEYVLNKLKERYDAKLNRDYDTADEILDELRFLKNVEVDDMKRMYRAVDPFKVEYTFGGKRINNINPDILQDIESKIKERANAKKKKDYDLADYLLKELTEKDGVRVDDVKKEWHFMRKKGSSDIGKGDRNALSENNRKSKLLRDNQSRRIDSTLSDWSIAGNGSKDNEIPEGISLADDIEIPEGISLVEGDEEKEDRSRSESIPIPEGILISEEDDHEQLPFAGSSMSESSIESKAAMMVEFESLTMPILKEKLREAGLPVSGRKKELIERLALEKSSFLK